jgi:hypothetical protein
MPQILHSSTPELASRSAATRSREVYFAKAASRRRSASRFAFQSAQGLVFAVVASCASAGSGGKDTRVVLEL